MPNSSDSSKKVPRSAGAAPGKAPVESQEGLKEGEMSLEDFLKQDHDPKSEVNRSEEQGTIMKLQTTDKSGDEAEKDRV